MFRALLELIITILVAMVARAVFTSVMKGFGSAASGAFQQQQQRPGPAEAPKETSRAGELHKDPVLRHVRVGIYFVPPPAFWKNRLLLLRRLPSKARRLKQTKSATSLIRRGTPAFRHTNLALFSAGFATFALMYCVQPLLPLFARLFHVSAAASSLAISSVTASVAVAILLAGSVSEAWGRKPVMTASMFSSAILTTLSPLAPRWSSYLRMRTLEGLAFSGLPAVAMAYLSEEMHPSAIGLAMGLYVGGTAVGGMRAGS